MKMPLLLKVYRALRKGWKSLTPDAQRLISQYVASQKTQQGYLNAGGKADEYYTQFGVVLEAVIHPGAGNLLHGLRLGVKEHKNEKDVYGVFFRFLRDEWRPWRKLQTQAESARTQTSNGVCCMLAMQLQTAQLLDEEQLQWLVHQQDETGGFRASELAPLPDLLSTAVALFTLQLIGRAPLHNASDFILAHWLDDGSFAPTILDEYSDVEYVFYGLLALGSKPSEKAVDA